MSYQQQPSSGYNQGDRGVRRSPAASDSKNNQLNPNHKQNLRNSCDSNTVGGKKPATLFEIYRKIFDAGKDLGTEQDIECSESFLVAIDALNKYQYTDNIQFFSDPKADLTDRIDVLTKQELIRDNMQLEQNLENTREQLNKTLADRYKERELKARQDEAKTAIGFKSASRDQDEDHFDILAPVLYLKCDLTAADARVYNASNTEKVQINGGLFRLRNKGIRIPLHNHSNSHTFTKIVDGLVNISSFSHIKPPHKQNIYLYSRYMSENCGYDYSTILKHCNNWMMNGLTLDISADAKKFSRAFPKRTSLNKITKRIKQLCQFHASRFTDEDTDFKGRNYSKSKQNSSKTSKDVKKQKRKTKNSSKFGQYDAGTDFESNLRGLECMNADYFDKIFSEGNYDCLSTSSSIDKVALKKIHEMRALRPLFVKLDRTVRVSKYDPLCYSTPMHGQFQQLDCVEPTTAVEFNMTRSKQTLEHDGLEYTAYKFWCDDIEVFRPSDAEMKAKTKVNHDKPASEVGGMNLDIIRLGETEQKLSEHEYKDWQKTRYLLLPNADIDTTFYCDTLFHSFPLSELQMKIKTDDSDHIVFDKINNFQIYDGSMENN